MNKKFVISPIDKASNNFAIICKKFYLEVIQGELGISEKIKGNSVYKPVKGTHTVSKKIEIRPGTKE